MAPRTIRGDAARMRRAREIWVQIVRQFEQSGLTQEAYADERGIPVATLRSWIYRLRREAHDEAPLLPVRVVASTAPLARQSGDEAVGLEVDLGDVRLRFARGASAAEVAELVALLRVRC